MRAKLPIVPCAVGAITGAASVLITWLAAGDESTAEALANGGVLALVTAAVTQAIGLTISQITRD